MSPRRIARRTGPGSLGQNFLVDPNIIDVIARLADLHADDVVLEIGGGEGILTRRLVADTAHVHLIEIDRTLAPGLEDILSGGRGSLHLADAVSYDLSTLEPAPTKLVANLPYSVAASVILNSVFATAITDWVVMVQREVGERLAAAPGTSAYGVPSVLAQLLCDVRVLRPVSRQVFRPVPNVDSVLVGLHRRGGGGADPGVPMSAHVADSGGPPGRMVGFGTPDQGSLSAVRSLVHDAFAHRRKVMATSVSLARGGSSEVRDAVRAALLETGQRADVRAERLSPQDFVAVAGALAAGVEG